MNATTYHTATTRAAARLDRRNAPAMRDSGARDLFGAPILEPVPPPPPPPDPPAWIEERDDETVFVMDHAPDARPEPLPPVYFRPSLFEEPGQMDFFGG